MLRISIHSAFLILGAVLTFSVPALAGPVDDYFAAFERYAQTGQADARAEIERFQWPQTLTVSDQILVGVQFYKWVRDRQTNGLTNQKLAIAVDALGRLLHAPSIQLKKQDALARQIQQQYDSLRSEALTELRSLYVNLPEGRDRTLLETNLSKAFASMQVPVPARPQPAVSRGAVSQATVQKHPLERVVEAMEKFKPGTTSNDAAELMNEIQSQMRKVARSKVELSREARFALAERYLNAVKAVNRPKLLLETHSVASSLIGPKHVEHFRGETEQKTRDGLVDLWTGHFREPEKLPPAYRRSLVDEALKELDRFKRPPPAIERYVHFISQASRTSQATRKIWLDKAATLNLDEGLAETNNRQRFALADGLVQELLRSKLDEQTKAAALTAFEKLLDPSVIRRVEEDQKLIRSKVASLIDSYVADKNTTMGFRSRASEVRAVLSPVEPVAGDAPATERSLSAWERARALAKQFETGKIVPGETGKFASQLTDLVQQSVAEKIPRDERFKLAQALLDAWKGSGRPSLMAQTAPLIGQLIGKTSNDVERYRTGEEDQTRQALIQYFNQQFDDTAKLAPVYRNQVLDAAQAQLEALRAPRHPLQQFAHFIERAGQVSPSHRAVWFKKAEAILPTLAEEELRPKDRFPLAQKIMEVLEGDPRIAGATRKLEPLEAASPTATDTGVQKPYLSTELELMAKGLSEILNRDQVRRAEGSEIEGVTQSIVRENAERVLSRMSGLPRLSDTFRAQMESAILKVGAIPIFDADSYFRALEELTDLEKNSLPQNYNRRRKLELALNSSDRDALLSNLIGPERQKAIERASEVLKSDSSTVLNQALETMESLGKKKERRRADIPPSVLDRLRALSGQDVRTSETLRRLRDRAAVVLDHMGHQSVVQLGSAPEYMRALREVAEHTGPATDRTRALESAIEAFDAKKLGQNMSPEDRALAIGDIVPILNSSSKWAKLRALAASPPLLNTSTVRESIAGPSREKIWDLTARKDDETIQERELRGAAILSLESMGEKPARDIAEWIQALETAHAETRNFQRVGSGRMRVLDLFNLDVAAKKLTASERRDILSRISKILAEPESSIAIKQRAIAAFGDLGASEVRGGSGIPRNGIATLRSMAASGATQPAIQKSIQSALSRMGASHQLPLTPLFELELYDDIARQSIADIVKKLRSPSESEKLEGIGWLQAWNVDEISKASGIVAARQFSGTLSELVSDSSLAVRRAVLRQLWMWSREQPTLPKWMADNANLRQGLVKALGLPEPEYRAIGIEIIGNRLPPEKDANPTRVAELFRMIATPDVPEDARWTAARALLNQNVPASDVETAKLKQRGLRTAFARAPEARKGVYAELLGEYGKQGAARPADTALLAAGWLRESLNAQGNVDAADLARLAHAGLSASSPSEVERAWGALQWLSADSYLGRQTTARNEPVGNFPVPEWMVSDSTLVETMMRHLVHPNERIRASAEDFFRTRQPWNQPTVARAMRKVAWSIIAESDRYPRSTALLSNFVGPGNQETAGSKVIWSSEEAHAALKAITAIHPQFHPEAMKNILSSINSVDRLTFDATADSEARIVLAEAVATLAEKLDSEGNVVTRPATMKLAGHIWRGSGRTEVPKAITNRVVSLFRKFASDSNEETLDLQRLAKETLAEMGRKEKTIPANERKRRERAERPSLLDVVSRLLSEFPQTQMEAVEDLRKWRRARPGEVTLNQELKRWHKEGGPDFDELLSRVLREPPADAVERDVFSTPEIRRELAKVAVDLIREGAKAEGFQPGMRWAQHTNRVMADLLFSADPALRDAAESWLKRIRTPEDGGSDSSFVQSDPHLQRVLAEALLEPNRQKRAREVLQAVIPNKLNLYMPPPWLSASKEIQSSLLKAIASLPVDEKESAAELLLQRIGAGNRPKPDEKVRHLEKTDDGYVLVLTDEQKAISELVVPALDILEKGDAYSKVAAMEFLLTLKIPDSRIPTALLALAADTQQSKAVREQALESLAYRNLRWDFGPNDPQLDRLVAWTWDRFINEKDPELRREAARVLFSNTGLIRSMPSPRRPMLIDGKILTTAHGVLVGLRDLEAMTAHNPLPRDLGAAARLAYDEVFGITSANEETALGRMVAASRDHSYRSGAEGTAPSRSALRAFALKCTGIVE
jgi:hypothetical protein